ncbi:metal-dependent hydrolase [Candidatus Dojkabacteria bacterium]|uniref:Metal-dependent hydrolase n=1 Tax=Candidatus Dojkabacteria bacterium TaxID=2099670 RepID=A0A955L0H8_9BACT|nr:metal-dependent hydrolase [Candidatus Dojkabacteria bacterium]
MTFLSHAFVGASAGVILSNVTGVDPSLTVPLNIGISLLPDINLLWRKISDHHDDITHYPIVWIILSIVASVLEGNTHIYSLSILFSGIMHLILDTFGMTIGVHWFAPFNSKQFSFTKIHPQTASGDLKAKILQFLRTGQAYYEFVTILSSIFLVLIFL